jgi:maltose-binding protein MalE
VNNQQVVLTYWRPFADSQEMQTLISQYQSKHPNVRIEYAKKNIETYEDDLLNALASGTGPDIFAINNSWTPKYVNKIVAAPQDNPSFIDYKDTFVDVVVDDFTANGLIYGVALSVDSFGTYTQTWTAYENAFAKYKFDEALEVVWNLLREADRTINEEEQWKMAGKNDVKLHNLLHALATICYNAAWFVYPFMPDIATSMIEQLGLDSATEFSKSYKKLRLEPGTVIKKGAPLFPRLEEKKS